MLIATLGVLLVMLALPARAKAQIMPALLPDFNDTEYVRFLGYPTAMAIAPDGRIFITEKAGRVRVVKNGVLLATPFVTRTVRTERERGMIGIGIDPNFATNHYVYVRYTPGSASAGTCRHLLSRFTADGDVAATGSEVILFDMGDCVGTGNHYSGAIHFGIDTKLYTTIGEQGVPTYAQDLSVIYGKMLRLNPDGTIPTDNPLYNTTTGINRAIWAYGLRNAYTFAIQPGTGKILINDVGENTWEEVNVGQAGANYGWPNCEGPCSPPNPKYVDPISVYSHTDGCAITGGTFYNPSIVSFPTTYVGKYFFEDWCGRWIRLLNPATHNVWTFASNLGTDTGRPVDMAVGPDRSLYWLNQDFTNGMTGDSSLHKIQHSTLPAISRNPRTITAVATQVVTFTVIASGNGPLTYQWQKNGVNIAGATTANYRFTAASADNGAKFRCIVTNSAGSVTSANASLTVNGNRPPTGTITQPVNGTTYRAGDTIHFAGTATDPEDGTLPASAFSWTIKLHHENHEHDYRGPLDGITSGSFTIPTVDETDPNVWYRIYLTVHDAQGLAQTTYRDVLPLKSTITLASNPPGLQVTLDGAPHITPYSTVSVQNLQRTLGVVSPQSLNGITYTFASWSDGGSATHNISTPTTNVTYTAKFQEVPIFADNFESGNFSKWTQQWTDSGDLSVSTAAALVGTKGTQALLDDNTSISVMDETPAGETHYRARFYFNPHSLAMASGDSHVLFFGYGGTSLTSPVVGVELQFASGSYRVRAALRHNDAIWRYGAWVNISNSMHYLELEWQAASASGANDGLAHLWVDGILRSNLTGIDNDTLRIDRVRLGAVAGIDAGTRGTDYFDDFESRRSTYIGAAPGGPAIAAAAADEAQTNTWFDEDQNKNPNFAP